MNAISLSQFFIDEAQREHATTVELVPILEGIADACKKIAKAINQGALQGTMGSLDAKNVQGETQKQLDVITNDIFVTENSKHGLIAGMVSEEMEQIYIPPNQSVTGGKYLLLFDPLDGSSNVNVNISVGTIFSVLRCPKGVTQLQAKDFLQAGSQQICAGYALYGSSTILVFTTGHGVNGFTLDVETDVFFLTHPNMQIPADTNEFAINISNYRYWEVPVQRYIDACLQGKEGLRGKDFNMRWVASMVAEIHRILVRGGIFMYPADSKTKQRGGKLRLLYEANPMSFIIEQAGGTASTGYTNIMDIQPTALHQRIPVILGARNEVSTVVSYHRI
jgi:fructose-1,6-bisphosphatase I